MKKIWFLLPFLLFAEEDFISDFEYGQMLYNNPRGISCAECHGQNGEGKEIVEYRDIRDKTKVIRGSDIRDISLEEIEAIVARNHPVMPKYYLTHEEVEAIYDFIQEKNRREGYVPPSQSTDEGNTSISGTNSI
ncbi:MAG: cytochrome c [Campylobacterota bacterium]|nr:cytochrome c [Campylobacterota bacterium]